MEWRGSMPLLGNKLDSLVAECLAASADSGVDREEKVSGKEIELWRRGPDIVNSDLRSSI